ncbi:hypothetical protein PDIG_62530 [Penicillium digitatum PHI26]|uniref:Uncharacterized protein n=2 Tax=Penicillium digitatum TaxID=36651 RepID=K9G366_PEND2|nr:hypothetical protein PDIP_71910 [Penicillium digitatum Pd1]EKV07813.1 hypothetical protein PDIP_71910 [Penicillium digitatum Pd1]EKV09303.1 hypothetical protein PDIG_62530 [Penicillium digitatum PHI26]
MCLFMETHYFKCNHTCFELYLFCHEILRQLNRINDPDQLKNYDLPFDPDCPTCHPYTITMIPTARHSDMKNLGVFSESNIVHQTMDLVQSCPDCNAKGL